MQTKFETSAMRGPRAYNNLTVAKHCAGLFISIKHNESYDIYNSSDLFSVDYICTRKGRARAYGHR